MPSRAEAVVRSLQANAHVSIAIPESFSWLYVHMKSILCATGVKYILDD